MKRSRTTNMTSYTTTILLLLAAAATFRPSSAGTPEGRIVGGHDADYLEYPFFTSWGKSCGATLIHDDILLTAAHVSRENHHNSTRNSRILATFDYITEKSRSQTFHFFFCFSSLCSTVQSCHYESSDCWCLC